MFTGRRYGGVLVMSSPSSRIWPEVASSKPASMRSRSTAAAGAAQQREYLVALDRQVDGTHGDHVAENLHVGDPDELVRIGRCCQ